MSQNPPFDWQSQYSRSNLRQLAGVTTVPTAPPHDAAVARELAKRLHLPPEAADRVEKLHPDVPGLWFDVGGIGSKQLPQITHFKIPRRQLLKREEIQASIVRLWVDGHQQKAIARAFGYKNNTTICLIIMRFCLKYAPEKTWRPPNSPLLPDVSGEDRRRLAAICLDRYHLRGAGRDD
jgi:hypothetical protein